MTVSINAVSIVDSTFNAAVQKTVQGTVKTIAIEADGKVIIGGNFDQVNGVLRNNIARLNSDGTLDQTFDPGNGFNNTVEKVAVQPDGKILVGGSFTAFNIMERVALVRLNVNGSLDSAFDPNILNGVVYSIEIQPDGKILIGGSFSTVGNQIRNGIARLNSDGTLDAGFDPILGNPPSLTVTVRRVLLLENGKIIVGGSFNGVNDLSRNNLIRLNANGTLDPTFNAANVGEVSLVESYPNGKLIVVSSIGLVRLNGDGTRDDSFQPSIFNGIIYAILVQPDGTVIVGGSFTTFNSLPRMRLVRLRTNGIVDTNFFPVGADDVIRAIVRQSDGRLLIGGDFTMFEGIARLAVAGLILTPVRPLITPFDFDGDGKADISVFRPSNGFWYELRSQNNSFFALQFGLSTDKLAPADYDGDGKTDIAVFRENVFGAGDKAYFYIIYSSDNSFHFAQLGTQGDLPISGDWDGDGIDDLAVYHDALISGRQSFIYYRPSSQPNEDFRSIQVGTKGDTPVRGDFDGDGKLDAAVVRSSNATWYIVLSSNGQKIQEPFGLPADIPVPADYDGDGKTNIAVYCPSTGYWYTSTDPQINFGAVQFGTEGDLPVPADYDGDGRADIAVFRPSNGVWYLLRSSAGFTGVQFGAMQDRPIPNAYIR